MGDWCQFWCRRWCRRWCWRWCGRRFGLAGSRTYLTLTLIRTRPCALAPAHSRTRTRARFCDVSAALKAQYNLQPHHIAAASPTPPSPAPAPAPSPAPADEGWLVPGRKGKGGRRGKRETSGISCGPRNMLKDSRHLVSETSHHIQHKKILVYKILKYIGSQI